MFQKSHGQGYFRGFSGCGSGRPAVASVDNMLAIQLEIVDARWCPLPKQITIFPDKKHEFSLESLENKVVPAEEVTRTPYGLPATSLARLIDARELRKNQPMPGVWNSPTRANVCGVWLRNSERRLQNRDWYFC
jgi:hypothetical protein